MLRVACQQVSASRFGTFAPYAVSGAVEGLTISRWIPPQRVHRMVQYSAPARPGMMRRTASEALQSGQFESTGVACRICSGGGREIWPAVPPPALRIREPRLETIDMGFRVRDRRFRIRPGEADFQRRKRHSIDHHRRLVGPLNPGVPLPSPCLERLNFKSAIDHGVSLGFSHGATEARLGAGTL